MAKFAEVIAKICKEKNLTKKDLAPVLGLSQSTLSRINRDWETHWRVFKKIVLEVYPMALLDDPLEADQLWHYFVLLIHAKAPEGKRHQTWGRIREIIEEELAKELRGGHDDNAETTKRRRPRKSKA